MKTLGVMKYCFDPTTQYCGLRNVYLGVKQEISLFN
jgi:hypothetical protein